MKKRKVFEVQIKAKRIPSGIWYSTYQNRRFLVTKWHNDTFSTDDCVDGCYKVLGKGHEFDLIGAKDCKIIPDEAAFAEWLSNHYVAIHELEDGTLTWKPYGMQNSTKAKTTKHLFKKWKKKFRTYKKRN